MENPPNAVIVICVGPGSLGFRSKRLRSDGKAGLSSSSAHQSGWPGPQSGDYKSYADLDYFEVERSPITMGSNNQRVKPDSSFYRPFWLDNWHAHGQYSGAGH